MWIVLGIIGFLALLITVILLLPVKIILWNDAQNGLNLRYKFLFKTFGEDPDPNDPIILMLKSATGVDRLEKETVKKSIRKDGLLRTVKESYAMIIDLLKEILVLLRDCTVRRLHIKIRCGGDGADEAAICYGESCAATYSLLNVLRSYVKVRERGCNIDIGCDFEASQSVFRYDAVLVLRTGRVLARLWKVAMDEVKRKNQQELARQRAKQKAKKKVQKKPQQK